MTLGEGIFYSALFLGLIVLFVATKDRWNWKKLILWPLGIILTLSAISGAAYYYLQMKDAKEKEIKAEAIRQKILSARSSTSTKDKKWTVLYEPDPASGKMVARVARINSNDGLCSLSVEKRVNGAELTDIHCPDLGMSEFEDLEVKFDTYTTSDKMDLKSYKNSDYVYIPPYQSKYSDSGYLEYSEFINRLKNGNAVAISTPTSGGMWIIFNLKGAADAINTLGNVQAAAESRHSK